jgi:DNA-binding NarL/FixJ family response regulator
MRAQPGEAATIRVLIAEDEDMFAELVEALVASDERIEVVGRAHHGQKAVELARMFAPDVIVMDIGMPVIDGIEATRRIRKANPAVRIVIFTGSDDARDVERAREAGANAYVQKAHINAVLLAAIDRAARQNGSRSTPAPTARRLDAAVALP